MCANVFGPRYPFALTAAEVGAFLSHRAAWTRIVDEGLEFAFVFEDDAEVDKARFAALLDFAIAERSKWDYRAAAGRRTSAQGRDDCAPWRSRAGQALRAAAEGDRTVGVARRGRAPFVRHAAVRPAGGHVSADGLGDRAADAYSLSVADSRCFALKPAGRRSSASRCGSSNAYITRRCGRYTGRKCWPDTAGTWRAFRDKSSRGSGAPPKAHDRPH